MATPQFAEGLAKLTRVAQVETTAVMCAEAVPWRCHRSLIADAMLVWGWEVRDIVSAAHAALHKPTSFLRVLDGELTYPDPDAVDEVEAPPLFGRQKSA